MDDSVICLEDSTEVIDLCETSINPSSRHLRNNLVENPPTREKREKQKVKSNIAPAAIIDLSNEPDLSRQLEHQTRQSTEMCCPICFEQFSNVQLKATICGHVFCSECIETAVREKRTCPTCRKTLTLKKLITLYL